MKIGSSFFLSHKKYHWGEGLWWAVNGNCSGAEQLIEKIQELVTETQGTRLRLLALVS
jgi:hypothetical protein